MTWIASASAYRTSGLLAAIKSFFCCFGRVFVLHRNFYNKVFNYIVILAFVPVMVLLIGYYGNMTVALRVTFNGTDVGYISESLVYDEAYAMMQSRIITETDELLTIVPAYSMAFVQADELLTADELCDNMIVSSFDEISYARGLYADSVLIGAVADADALDTYLESYLDVFQSKHDDCTVSFATARTADGYYPLGSLITVEKLSDIVKNGSHLDQMTYVVASGDTYESIATNFSMQLEHLYKLNDIITEPVAEAGNDNESETEVEYIPEPSAGDVITVEYVRDVLSLKLTYVEEYIAEVDFQTKNIADSTHYIGYSIVKQTGEKGSANIVAEVSYVYGVESERSIVKNVTLEAAVDEILVVGTRVSTAMQTASDYYSAKYYWPVKRVPGSYISAYYGDNRNHLGIDIAAPKGTDIYAADTGTVVLAGYDKGGYGNYVKITHADGYQTFYAHCSQVLVSVGDRVARGDLIAYVGTTGYSTGNHLHFEVRLGNDRLNPAPYLGLSGNGAYIPGTVDTTPEEDKKDDENLPSDYTSSLDSSTVSPGTDSSIKPESSGTESGGEQSSTTDDSSDDTVTSDGS